MKSIWKFIHLQRQRKKQNKSKRKRERKGFNSNRERVQAERYIFCTGPQKKILVALLVYVPLHWWNFAFRNNFQILTSWFSLSFLEWEVFVNSPFKHASHHKQEKKLVFSYWGSVPTFVVDCSWPSNLYFSASSASGSAPSSQDSSSTATPTSTPSDNKRKRTRNDTEVTSLSVVKKIDMYMLKYVLVYIYSHEYITCAIVFHRFMVI